MYGTYYVLNNVIKVWLECGRREVVSLRRIRDPKSVRLKDRDYDVTPNIIAHMYPQIRNGSVKECEVYCGDG